MQTTSHLLMIRPVNFSFNKETAVNNAFQAQQDSDAQEKALLEFDTFIKKLQKHRIDVTVINDTPTPFTPDSIFPNNWISFHDDGSVFLYPMFAVNRRKERKGHIIETLKKRFGVSLIKDLSGLENQQEFLEGTGSMVLDRVNKIAYACLSPRTTPLALQKFKEESGFEIEAFTSVDVNGQEIYHTNVMMCVADRFVVICLESIKNPKEKSAVINKIKTSGKEIIEISFDQMNRFAGNMLQVHNTKGELFLVMSSQAFGSLSIAQVALINQYNKIIHSSLETIERNGGGSARCMMAEVFLPLLKA